MHGKRILEIKEEKGKEHKRLTRFLVVEISLTGIHDKRHSALRCHASVLTVELRNLCLELNVTSLMYYHKVIAHLYLVMNRKTAISARPAPQSRASDMEPDCIPKG